ncbi:hypothetical protein CVT24_005862, partial [Panaeolus cyanescens]
MEAVERTDSIASVLSMHAQAWQVEASRAEPDAGVTIALQDHSKVNDNGCILMKNSSESHVLRMEPVQSTNSLGNELSMDNQGLCSTGESPVDQILSSQVPRKELVVKEGSDANVWSMNGQQPFSTGESPVDQRPTSRVPRMEVVMRENSVGDIFSMDGQDFSASADDTRMEFAAKNNSVTSIFSMHSLQYPSSRPTGIEAVARTSSVDSIFSLDGQAFASAEDTPADLSQVQTMDLAMKSNPVTSISSMHSPQNPATGDSDSPVDQRPLPHALRMEVVMRESSTGNIFSMEGQDSPASADDTRMELAA